MPSSPRRCRGPRQDRDRLGGRRPGPPLGESGRLSREVAGEARVADAGRLEPSTSTPRRWRTRRPRRASPGDDRPRHREPRREAPPPTTKPSSVASILAPSALSPSTTVAMRSDSLWRSSLSTGDDRLAVSERGGERDQRQLVDRERNLAGADAGRLERARARDDRRHRLAPCGAPSRSRRRRHPSGSGSRAGRSAPG